MLSYALFKFACTNSNSATTCFSVKNKGIIYMNHETISDRFILLN